MRTEAALIPLFADTGALTHTPIPLGTCMHTTQVLGHFAARLDPLELDKRVPPPELDPAYWGFAEKDLDRE